MEPYLLGSFVQTAYITLNGFITRSICLVITVVVLWTLHMKETVMDLTMCMRVARGWQWLQVFVDAMEIFRRSGDGCLSRFEPGKRNMRGCCFSYPFTERIGAWCKGRRVAMSSKINHNRLSGTYTD